MNKNDLIDAALRAGFSYDPVTKHIVACDTGAVAVVTAGLEKLVREAEKRARSKSAEQLDRLCSLIERVTDGHGDVININAEWLRGWKDLVRRLKQVKEHPDYAVENSLAVARARELEARKMCAELQRELDELRKHEPIVWECKAGGLKPLSDRLYHKQPEGIKKHYTRVAPCRHELEGGEKND